MHDLLIIGGGPAGLTAAVYAIRKRLDSVLISDTLGGWTNCHMEIEGVDTHQVINGADIVRRFQREVEYLDFARVAERATALAATPEGFTVTLRSGKVLEGRAVILATGAEPVRLDAAGADRLFMRGVSYSVTSYAPLFIDKTVAVVGHGDLALHGAAELAQIAAHVYLLAPRHGELDSPLGARLAADSKVTVLEGWRPVAVEGHSRAQSLTLSGPEAASRVIEVEGVFIAMGLKPHSDLVRGLAELDAEGRVLVDCAAQTTVPGLFAAGDVTSLPSEQVLIAVAEGAKAALAAYEYLLRAGMN